MAKRKKQRRACSFLGLNIEHIYRPSPLTEYTYMPGLLTLVPIVKSHIADTPPYFSSLRGL